MQPGEEESSNRWLKKIQPSNFNEERDGKNLCRSFFPHNLHALEVIMVNALCWNLERVINWHRLGYIQDCCFINRMLEDHTTMIPYQSYVRKSYYFLL